MVKHPAKCHGQIIMIKMLMQHHCCDWPWPSLR